MTEQNKDIFGVEPEWTALSEEEYWARCGRDVLEIARKYYTESRTVPMPPKKKVKKTLWHALGCLNGTYYAHGGLLFETEDAARKIHGGSFIKLVNPIEIETEEP